MVVHPLEEADEGDVIDQGLGGGDNLYEVGIERRDLGVDAVEVLGGGEIVVADDEGDPSVAQLLQVRFFESLSGFELEVGEMEPGDGGLGQDFNFGGDRAVELAAECGATTGGDGGCGGVVLEELLELRHGREGLLEVVEAELEKRGFPDDRGRLFNHFGGRGADDGDAHLGEAGAEELGS